MTDTALRDAFAKAEKERDEAIAFADEMAALLRLLLNPTNRWDPGVLIAFDEWKAAR